MKTLFIEAKSDQDIRLDEDSVNKLKDLKLGILTTIQHLHKIEDVKDQLPDAEVGGQVLGCNASNAEKLKVDAYLYIGTGRFHPLNIARKTNKPTYTFDPSTKKLSEISKEEIEKYQKRRKGAMAKYLSAKTIGIIVSTKSGQNKLEKAKKFRNKLKKEGKEAYILIGETLDLNQLENFKFDAYVNTACPRMIEDTDKAMVNIEDIQ